MESVCELSQWYSSFSLGGFFPSFTYLFIHSTRSWFSIPDIGAMVWKEYWHLADTINTIGCNREGLLCLCLEERTCLGQVGKTALKNDWCERGRGQPGKHSRQNWEYWHDHLGAPSATTKATNTTGWQVRTEKRPTWTTPAPLSPLFPLTLYYLPSWTTHHGL